jgi:hypothetical protein
MNENVDPPVGIESAPTPSIHWTEIKGYKFQVKPAPLMLLPLGHTVTLKLGNHRKKDAMQWHKVKFDAAYVAAYFADHYKEILAVPGDDFRCKLQIALNPLLSPCGGHDAQVQE